MMRIWLALSAAMAAWAGVAWAQLPEGPGRAETVKACSPCHELARAVSLRLDRAGWESEVGKMADLGAQASDEEFEAIIGYLAKHYPAAPLPKVNINKASAIELESAFTLRRSQSAALIEYRTKNGPFHSMEDLKKVPGLDVSKIEAKKERVEF